jgi:hypothetical protein
LNFIYYYYYSRVDNDYFVTSPKRTNYYKKIAIKFVMFPVLEVSAPNTCYHLSCTNMDLVV